MKINDPLNRLGWMCPLYARVMDFNLDDNRIFESYLASYDENQEEFELTKSRVVAALEKRLLSANIQVHLVDPRVKTRERYEKKLKKDPRRPIEDVVGVRIITYFQEDVQPVLALVREVIKVDESTVVDKAALLETREFGYRSLQLVGRELPPPLEDGEPSWMADAITVVPLGTQEMKVEVQIRSILEHAWATVDHTFVYEPGKVLSESIQRRFALTAALLEAADENLVKIRNEVALNLPDATTEDVPEDFLQRFVETNRESKALDARIVEALGVPLGHPKLAEKHLLDAAFGASWRNTADLRSAVAKDAKLAFRMALVCTDTTQSLLGADWPAYCDLPAMGFPGIGLYWIAIATATRSADRRKNTLPYGRQAEYAEVARYLSDAKNKDVSALAIRDEYRRVTAVWGSDDWPQVKIAGPLPSSS